MKNVKIKTSKFSEATPSNLEFTGRIGRILYTFTHDIIKTDMNYHLIKSLFAAQPINAINICSINFENFPI